MSEILKIADSLARLPAVRGRRGTGVFLRPEPNWWDNPEERAARACARRAVAQLRNEGFHVLGAGHFSVALKHKDWPGRVLKVSIRHGLSDMSGDVEEDGAVAYWNYCLKNRGKKGKHLPVVYHVGKLMFAGEMVPYAWMKEYTAGDRDARGLLSASSLAQGHIPDGVARDLNVDQESWFEILSDVGNLGALDLHAGNIMFDPSLITYVITDPIL